MHIEDLLEGRGATDATPDEVSGELSARRSREMQQKAPGPSRYGRCNYRGTGGQPFAAAPKRNSSARSWAS